MVAVGDHNALDGFLHATDLCCDPGLWQGRSTLLQADEKFFLGLATAIGWLAISFGYHRDVLFHKLIRPLDQGFDGPRRC